MKELRDLKDSELYTSLAGVAKAVLAPEKRHVPEPLDSYVVPWSEFPIVPSYPHYPHLAGVTKAVLVPGNPYVGATGWAE